MPSISIKGLDKAAVLAALYNRAKVQGFGVLRAESEDMTAEQARVYLKTGDDHTRDFGAIAARRGALYFDYLNGRVMKINLAGDELETWGYNRDNGAGAAEEVIAGLRSKLG